MHTRWSVQERGTDGRWREVDAGPRLSTTHRVWSTARAEGRDVRLVLNGRPVRMTSTSEQLDLEHETDDNE